MRWDLLFDDLAAQWAADDRAQRRTEIADRTRRELAMISMSDRLAAAAGEDLSMHLLGHEHPVRGVLSDLGRDWVLLESTAGSELVHLRAVLAIDGLGLRADDRPGVLARRFGVGYVLRRLTRDRLPVLVKDCAGGEHTGTIDLVGKDFLQLAVHHLDVARRPRNVRAQRVIPFAGLGSVRSR